MEPHGFFLAQTITLLLITNTDANTYNNIYKLMCHVLGNFFEENIKY